MYADDMTDLVVGIPPIKSLMKMINDSMIVNNDKTELMLPGISDKNDTALTNLGYKILSEKK